MCSFPSSPKNFLLFLFLASEHPNFRCLSPHALTRTAEKGFVPSPGKTPEPNTHYHSVLVVNTHPISRGTVHIQSADPLAKPTVDPGYLSSVTDLDILAHGMRFARAASPHRHSLLKEMVIENVEPTWVGDNGDDEAVREYVRNELQSI
ncbi:hypothetical protein BS47DRAFT_65188 [Hydnum rufescens UP504]|uniref:Glucose-methanol-choline oxidoreductase C-terminal domain-containing protein n=1 Tax=Hydnum rufescens UP504 TaxID=1448309 RepID=A0A9P6ASA1_9AGAM|nr:hypothetical protein BS47DRAFT_65188 [Hydnum rufescens UP504]